MSLYKYVSEDRIDVLEESLIRFTHPLDWNDPFEMRPYYYDEEKFKFFHAKVDNKRYYVGEINNFINSHFVSLSLTESPDDLLMWAFYANNHKGFLIEFDENHLFFKRKNKHLFKLTYSNIRPLVSTAEIFPLCDKLIQKLQSLDFIQKKEFQIFTSIICKSINWENEKEWRLLSLKKFATKIKNTNSLDNNFNGIEKQSINKGLSKLGDIALFRFPMTSIKSISFGIKTSSDIKLKICEILFSNKGFKNIKVKQAYLHKEEYKLQFKDYEKTK